MPIYKSPKNKFCFYMHIVNYSNKQKIYKSGYGNKHTWTTNQGLVIVLKKTLVLFLNY